MTHCSCKKLVFDWNENEENGCSEKCFFILFNLYFPEALLPGTGIGTGFPTRQLTDLKLVARGSQSLSLASSV